MTSGAFEYLSEEAFSKLKKDLDYLTKQKRKEIVERLEAARDLGDLSENAEYQESKEEQLRNENRIAELEDIISRAVIISKKNEVRLKVELGCSVSLKKGDVVFVYHIVGSKESDPLKQKISHESPLGRSLMGRKKGEMVEALTPTGKIVYTITEIS